jgi:hypothetical protein
VVLSHESSECVVAQDVHIGVNAEDDEVALFGSLLEADLEIAQEESDGGGVWFALGLVVN